MTQRTPNKDSAISSAQNAAGREGVSRSVSFEDQRPEMVRQRQIVAGIHSKKVLQLTPVSDFLKTQDILQNDAITNPEKHKERLTTVGFEHEFVQMIEDQGLAGLSHLIVAQSSKTMPFTGIPFVLETDAGDALELVSPPFLLPTIPGHPVPLPKEVKLVDDLFRMRLQQLAKAPTIGKLVEGFNQDGIDFKLKDLTIQSEHMSDKTPEEIVGKKKKNKVAESSVEDIKLKKSTKNAKEDKEESHVITHVNFATDAETFDRMQELFSSEDKEGTEGFIRIENQLKELFFNHVFKKEVSDTTEIRDRLNEEIIKSKLSILTILKTLSASIPRYRIDNLRGNFNPNIIELEKLLAKGILSKAELMHIKSKYSALIKQFGIGLKSALSNQKDQSITQIMGKQMVELNAGLARADQAFERMPVIGEKSPQLRSFLNIMARNLSGLAGVQAMTTRRKAQKNRFKKGKNDDEEVDKMRHLASVVKDVKEVWIKDTLMNIGIGLLPPDDWSKVLDLVSQKGIKAQLKELDLPATFQLKGLSVKNFQKLLLSAFGQIKKDIKGKKLHKPSKKKNKPFIGPKKQPELFSHNKKWVGARQDTYIPQHPDPKKNKVQMPGIWGDKRLHVVESRADHIERLQLLEAIYTGKDPKKKEDKLRDVDSAFLNLSLFDADPLTSQIGTSEGDQTKKSIPPAPPLVKPTLTNGLNEKNAQQVLRVVSEAHIHQNPDFVPDGGVAAEGVVAGMQPLENEQPSSTTSNEQHQPRIKRNKKKSATKIFGGIGNKGKKKKGEGTRDYIRDMRINNPSLRQWLAKQNVSVASNLGDGLNCLIISLLQHATGNYGSQHTNSARYYRQKLIVQHGRQVAGMMLYSDDQAFMDLINWINADAQTSMDVYFVQVDENGLPYLVPHISTGAKPVVIWDQGGHYEALFYSK